MKHRENVPAGIVPVLVPGDDQPYMAIEGPEGLIALVQAAALEVHPWGSKVDRPELPDRMIFDLDPDNALPFREVVAAALEVRALLDERGLVSFVRATGGKGLHVVVPLAPRAGWDEVKAWSKALAEELVRRAPSRYVAVSTKARRKGKIFVDYLRNSMGATAIGSWWFRAEAHAPVARPLTWEEIVPELDPTAFTVRTVGPPAADPWAGIDEIDQSLPRGALDR
jgi:bifunctional non-homologous end joining protein LigD